MLEHDAIWHHSLCSCSFTGTFSTWVLTLPAGPTATRIGTSRVPVPTVAVTV